MVEYDKTLVLALVSEYRCLIVGSRCAMACYVIVGSVGADDGISVWLLNVGNQSIGGMVCDKY